VPDPANPVLESPVVAHQRNERAASSETPPGVTRLNSRRSFAVPTGCVLLLVSAVTSGTLLEATILPYGTIVGTERRAAALILARLALGAAGAYLVIRRPKLTAVHFAALAFGAVLAAVLGSILVQVAYVPPPLVCGWKAFAPAAERHQLGFRGQRISYGDDDRVVLLLGDSQVEAMAMPMGEMPERRLESYLNSPDRQTKVFSLGAGGYGQDQQFLALDEYFRQYRADLVVLWQTPGNDIWNNLFKTHMAGRNPKPTYWLDESGRLAGPSETLGQPLANSPIVIVSLWQRLIALPWRDKSWELNLPPAYVPLDSYPGPVDTTWQTRWDGNIGRMRDENLQTEKSHLAIGLTPRSARMQYGLDLTRALIKRIEERVTRQNGRLVVFRAETDDSALAGDKVYVLNGKYYRVSEEQFRANMNDVDRGFAAESIQVTVDNWRVSADDGHLNARATDQVMAELAHRLRGRFTAGAATAGTE